MSGTSSRDSGEAFASRRTENVGSDHEETREFGVRGHSESGAADGSSAAVAGETAANDGAFGAVIPSFKMLSTAEKEAAAADWPVRLCFPSIEALTSFLSLGRAATALGSERPRDVARAPTSPTTWVDDNLIQVAEFANYKQVAQSTVFEWLKVGLPSVKVRGLGRRIRRREADAWLLEDGPSRSRIAKRQQRAARAAGGGHDR